MSIITYPLDGVTYSAEDVATHLCTRTSGVYAKNRNFAASITGTRQVTIAPGLAWMNYDDFKGVSVCSREDTVLTVPDADNTLNRVDRVVLQFDTASNLTAIRLKTGTPAVAAQPPDILQNHNQYELGLCTISVPAGSAAISAADVTDTRADEDVCGVMRDGVTGIPTAQLIAQWRAAQAAQVAAGQALLDQLREEIKDGSAYSKTEADAKFALTADKISAALGYDPAAKITRLERIIGMDGKLVFSGAGVCTGGTTTMTIPSTVDYVEIVSAIPAMGRSSAGWTASSGYGVATSNAIGAASDFGHAKVVRGCSAAVPITSLTMMNDGKLDNYNSIGAKIESTSVSMVSVAFASGGTLSVSGGSSGSQFVVYGYQYL
jgi:hypothetical protein